MLKWLMSLTLSASIAFAGVHEYVKNGYLQNDRIKVIEVKTEKIMQLKDGFEANFLKVKLEISGTKKSFIKDEVVFTSGDLIVSDIINIKTKTSLKNELMGENVSIRNFKKVFDENGKNCN